MAQLLAATETYGITNAAIGSFVGAGTAVELVCGFKPRYLKLINLTDRTTYEVYQGMVADHALKTVAAGTMTDDTAAIKFAGTTDALGFRGFQIPAAIALNGKSFSYIAMG